MAFCTAVLFLRKKVAFIVRTLESSVLITVLFILKIYRAFTMMQTSIGLVANLSLHWRVYLGHVILCKIK